MEASTVDAFSSWLNGKLREFNTDESVFGSYITGILEGDENYEEKTEALEGILSEIIESDLSTFIKEILDKWNQCHSEETETMAKVKLDVDEQLAKLLENQKLTKKVEREYTDEERRIKQQILMQYSQLSEDEADYDEDEAGTAGAVGSSDGGLTRNTNAADVAALVKEKREQAKLESQQKKEKDKQDREKQKQLREEKKEKRKTVKGERRR
ncbi:coiled-coil domain-containing protein 43 [Toxorhynchites rutilus septentrionalis]|uniref:coiled-coil domain-containing protein 43 n=1 Tax=Toxorhynchites rutilus septentrionalis TaxID=329112 RepID=UPI00247948BF|nr:coiled-coil domain-containing protein 43 [Toxorhynchites rutilus septentrionalis]